MEKTQNEKLETIQDSTIMAWNPPTLFVFLLPLAWVSFHNAKALWVIINLILVIISALMLLETYNPAKTFGFTLSTLLFVILFPPIVSGLYMGQVTFLVLFGLVAFIYFAKKGLWFWAGTALVLTTIKPHLVILAGIYIAIFMIKEKQIKGWMGLLVSGLICTGILFFFRTEWINDLIGLSTIAPVNWLTPTIGGLLSYKGITEFGRYLIILLVPLPILLALYSDKFSLEFSLALLTLITIPFTFFGWNYDQSMLLIPIVLVFTWLANSKNSLYKIFIASMIIVGLGVHIYTRIISTNDMEFIWVPLYWGIIFSLTLYFCSPKGNDYEQTRI